MGRKPVNDKSLEMVECIYNGRTYIIPVKIFFRVTMGAEFKDKRYVRYKEGARMYGMCEREFWRLAHDADAIYKKGRLVLINLEMVDNYMEFLKQ